MQAEVGRLLMAKGDSAGASSAFAKALAKDALLHSRGTLEEIAETVGYQSASAFSTAFSQRVGCPPSDYARSAGGGTHAAP